MTMFSIYTPPGSSTPEPSETTPLLPTVSSRKNVAVSKANKKKRSSPVANNIVPALFSIFLLSAIIIFFRSPSSSSPSSSSPEIPNNSTITAFTQSPTPIVLWHGMGDSASGMTSIKTLLQEQLPGVFIYSIQVGETDSQDRRSGYFDNLHRQLQEVCDKLSQVKELENGFNALGFSQGGLFLRSFVEKCNAPRVKNLVTFGSPHAGVSDVPNCPNEDSAVLESLLKKLDMKLENEDIDLEKLDLQTQGGVNCGLMRSIVNRGVYLDWVQNKIVQAQYYKDPSRLSEYYTKNIFLPFLNNELPNNVTNFPNEVKNRLYKKNLNKLEKFVMVKFEQDTMIVPKETAWFEFHDSANATRIQPLRESDTYKEDWLGLKTMDNANKLVFLSWKGDHLQWDDETFVKDIVKPYLMNPSPSQSPSVPSEELAASNMNVDSDSDDAESEDETDD